MKIIRIQLKTLLCAAILIPAAILSSSCYPNYYQDPRPVIVQNQRNQGGQRLVNPSLFGNNPINNFLNPGGSSLVNPNYNYGTTGRLVDNSYYNNYGNNGRLVDNDYYSNYGNNGRLVEDNRYYNNGNNYGNPQPYNTGRNAVRKQKTKSTTKTSPARFTGGSNDFDRLVAERRARVNP